MPLEQFDSFCRRFAGTKARLMRPKGLAKVRDVLARGGKVVVVSASVKNWVEPFFADIPGVYVLGTMIGVADGKLTGRFITKNCYGEEKVNRLLQLFPERTQYWLTAYGDSRGDTQLLDFANEGYYKLFK